MNPFVHLHVHSNFSFLDGATPPERLLQRAAELEMPALALTDHHGLYGAVRFMQAAAAYGVKPIIGVEVEVVSQLPDGNRDPNPKSKAETRNWELGTGNLEPPRSHLVLLAQDRAGYASLCRIVTKAQLDHQDDPHIALEDLAALTKGVIALSGCCRGEVAQALPGRASSNLEEAVSVAGRYAEMFGRENFWIELEHHLLPGDDLRTEQLLEVASRAGVGHVITNDVHYANADEYRLRDVMACIQTNTTLEGWADVRHHNAEYYLKSAAELRLAFRALPDEAVEEGLRASFVIASRCNLLDGDSPLLATITRPPTFEAPEGENPVSYLRALCDQGLRQKYRPLTSEAVDRLGYELNVVEQMDLSEFFLCVWDIVRFSRDKGIRCAGRGSAADSIIAYVLDITTVDPLANNLLFDRFLNPGRVGMPDVDIDFDSRRRDEVIEYVENKYGPEHAAMVANLVTYRSRSAFRDVAKAMGYPPGLVDHIASSLSYRSVTRIREDLQAAGIEAPGTGESESQSSEEAPGSSFKAQRAQRSRKPDPEPQRNDQSKKAHPGTGNQKPEHRTQTTEAGPQQRATRKPGTENRELRTGNGNQKLETRNQKLDSREPGTGNRELKSSSFGQLDTIIQLCEQLDGYPRHLSLHNGGMLITREPLVDIVPLEYATSGVRVCQFNKDDVESLGLIKFDILGLRTLSIVDEAVTLIREARGIELPIDDLPLDDRAVYDFICTSKTIGVFQIESPGQWHLLQRAQPRTFGDLIIQIALFRPGPLQGGMVNPYIERRCGREPVSYMHPSLEDALRDTLGVVIFQEQVLQVAHDFAGLSYAEADGLRRAMSHYRTDAEMDVCRTAFVESAVRMGRDREQAEEMYHTITYFSGYGFCRSHAAAFAKTVYQTAFLKTYFAAEFLAAILSNEPCCYYPTQTVVEDARKWGIQVLPVDVNRSRARYHVEPRSRVSPTAYGTARRGEWYTPASIPSGAIRMGFLQVKGLSEDAAKTIVEARAAGPFRSLADFWRRTSIDRDAVHNLIAVGAFDSLGVPRRKLLWQLEEVIRTTPRLRNLSADTGRGRTPALPFSKQTNMPNPARGRGWVQPVPTNLTLPADEEGGLGANHEPLPDLPPLTELDLAGLDMTLQNASARYSVMEFYRRSLRAARIMSIGEVQGKPNGLVLKTAGIVVSRQQPPTANGMTFLVLSDEEGELPAAVPPQVYKEYRRTLSSSASLVVEGTLQRHRRYVSLMVKRMWNLREVAQLDTQPYRDPLSEPTQALGIA